MFGTSTFTSLRIQQPLAHAAQVTLDRRRIDEYEVARQVDRLVVRLDLVFGVPPPRKRHSAIERERQRSAAARVDT